MSEESKKPEEESATIEKDPTELPEGFMEQDEADEEISFAKKYGDPGVGPKEIEEGTTAKKEEKDDDDGKEGDDGKGEEEEKFEFDESLAESEKTELEELNAKLGTNFEKLDDLKNALNKTDSKEDLIQIEEDKRFISYYASVLEYESEKIVREDSVIKAQQAKPPINTNTDDFKDELDLKIAKMKEGGFLDYAGDALKSTVRVEKEKLENKVKDFDNSQKETREQEQASHKEKLKAGVNALFKQGTFFGIKVEKSDLLDIYSDIAKNKHINHLKANPEDAVKFGFFLKHEKTIMALMNRPSYQEGVQKTLKEIGMQSSSTSSKTVSKDKDGAEEDLSFLELFAK